MRPRLVPELICSDLEKSIAFYVGVLGFSILYARPEDLFTYLDRGGAELMLEQFEPDPRMLAKAPFERPYGRGINFQIQVENVEAVHAAVVSAGLTPFLPLEERWYRRDETEIGVRQFIAQDPDGYLIRLSQSIGTRPIAR